MPRHPKGETFTGLRDPRSGEVLVECKGCHDRVDPRVWWVHVCPRPTDTPDEGNEKVVPRQ